MRRGGPGRPSTAAGRRDGSGTDGRLDPARYARYRKLAREDAHNSAALHERRARDRDFGRMVKRVMKEKTGRRDQ